MNVLKDRGEPSVLLALLLLTGLSLARAADSDEFDAKMEQHKDDSHYHLINEQDSKPELDPAVKNYQNRSDIEADDKYILGGQNAGKQATQKQTPSDDNPPKQ